MRGPRSRAPRRALSVVPFLLVISGSITAAEPPGRESTVFSGSKVNRGRVHLTKEGRVTVLTLSDDFVVPETPAPHWQLVDSTGNAYLLQRLQIKEGKVNKSIRVPAYVPDVARVEIWCAWAETLLGEAAFERPQKPKINHRSADFSGAKVNGGHVIHARVDSGRGVHKASFRKGTGSPGHRSHRRDVLTLSKDFIVPDSPAPHWQVVDSAGNTYLLQSLKIKGDRVNRSIRLPSYVPDVARVEIWCAWAETLLGEAAFDTPIRVVAR